MAFFEEDGEITTFRDRRPIEDRDALPGNFENSRAYSRLYDPQGELEYTNLPENAAQLELANLVRARNKHLRNAESEAVEFREALKRVQYWQHAGRYIIPKQNTFAAHLALVREGNQVDIQFDPKTYLYFDKVIVEHANKPELFNPNHPDYQKYASLRENLAVMRNDLMGDYMDDGSFDPGDEKYLPLLAQIAAEIGDALNADNKFKKVVFPSIDTKTVNVEGEGAAYLYEFLLKRQVPETTLGNGWAALREFVGMPRNQWKLPPIEFTAYSTKGLNALPPVDEMTNISAHELRRRAVEQAEEIKAISDPTDTHLINEITSPERREAIKHGKTIIEWLKNIQFSEKSLQDFVDSGRPGEQNTEKDAMNTLVDAYYNVMDTAVHSKPSILENEKIQAANKVLEAVEHSIELMAKLENPHSHEDAMDIGAAPDNWDDLSKETVERLMTRIKDGLEHAIAEIELQQDEVDQAREAFADQQVDEALSMQKSYMAKRARKQKGANQQQRIDRALRADDQAAGQGAYADDDDDAIRIARQKVKTDSTIQAARRTKQGDNTTKNAKDKAADESMETKIAMDKAMNKNMGGKTTGAIPANGELVKQLGKNLMHMQQQANVAASEIADVKGGGIGTGESHTDRQDSKTNLTNKNKPQIG